jgi:hypothetical protein
MKKFLYLRIVAIVTLVAIITYIAFIVYFWLTRISSSNWYIPALSLTVLALLASHSIIVLFIYHKYYPDKEINKAAMTYYRLSVICCWILNGLLLLSIVITMAIAMTFEQSPDPVLSGKRPEYSFHLYTFLSAIIIGVQLIGGQRMLKTIRQNARHQLENSFT